MNWHYQATRDHGIIVVREIYEDLQESGPSVSWTENPVYAMGGTKEEVVDDIVRMLIDVLKFDVLDLPEEK